jgi:hypothetical protein
MPYPTLVTRLAVLVLLASGCSASAGLGAKPLSTAATTTTTISAAATTTTTATTTTSNPATTTTANVTPGTRPNPQLTPGATDPRVTQADIGTTICRSGYTATVRPPVSVTNRIKAQAMAAYGIFDNPSNYELDHLIALELGGAPADIGNLWPEPWENRGARRAAPGMGAESKDRVENAAHAAVCSGRLALADAQRSMAADWYAFGRSLAVF